MAVLPWFKIYAAETLSDENFQGWTVEERGAWFTLLLVNWREGSIPSDEGAIARLLHVDGNRMRLLWQAIGDRFVEHPDHPGRLTSPRLEKEREEAEALVETRSTAGKKGATSRWDRKNRPNGKRMRPHSDRNAKPMASDSDPAQPSPESDPESASLPVPINGAPAAVPTWLAGVAERVGLELGRTMAIGKDGEAVVQAFTRYRESVVADGRFPDPDATIVTDCLEIAKRSRAGPPGTLSFFVGWLKRETPAKRANGGIT